MTRDPLSDLLTLLDARCLMSGRLVAGGPWALRFPRPDALKVSAALKGGCWLLLDGVAEPRRLEAGDVILLDGRRSFVLATDLDIEPLDAVMAFTGRSDRIARLGQGEDFYYVGGHVALDPKGGDLLRDALPPLIHVRAGSPEAEILRWLLDQLYREMQDGRPGASLATAHIAQLMFVQVLRSHLSLATDLAAGWLKAMADPHIAPALRMMHADPARTWILAELAQAVGMSRTSFAERFRLAAGVAPLTYLTNWRMRLAEHSLRETDIPVATIGLSLGYGSESAFSNAFRRVNGDAPKRYRSAHRIAAGDEIVDQSMPKPDRQGFRIAL